MEHLDLRADARVWVASDHHFNHKRIIELSQRPFESLGHMNIELVRRHTELVAPEDVFIALGDLCLGNFEESLGYAAMLTGQKFLVPGNHDRVSSAMRQRPGSKERFQAMYEDAGFTVLPETGVTVDIGGHRFALSHYPYQGDHTESDRHVALRPHDDGLPLLHGHIHALRRIDGRMFNVGVDVNDFAPVSQEQILAFVEGLR